MGRKRYNRVYKRYKKYDRIITKINKKHSLSEQMRVVLLPTKNIKSFKNLYLIRIGMQIYGKR